MRNAFLTLSACCLFAVTAPAWAQGTDYPETAKVEQVDETFGIKVADPFRWLENDVRQDPKVKAWVDAQNRVTSAYLSQLPKRDAIEKRLTELWNFERYGMPERKGGRYFFTRNSGLQNQSPLFVQDGLDGTPRLLIDPNPWAQDGATALAGWLPSEDGKRLLYAVQDGGTDWRTVRVMDVDSGKLLDDQLKWVKFSDFTWAKDGSGFYYSRFPEPETGAEFQSLNIHHKVYFHRVGTPQSADRLVHATPAHPKWNHNVRLTDDGRWLVVFSSEGTEDRYEVNIADLSRPDARLRTLFAGPQHSWSLVGSRGSRLVFVTNKDAPRYRVVSVDAALPGTPSLEELVAEAKGTLDQASIVGDAMIISYVEDAKSVVRRFGLDGRPKGDIPLPGIGSVSGFAGDPGNPETFYSYTSFNAPPTIYRYDAATGDSTVFRAPDLPFDPALYTVEQRFFASKDGTKVPMFVAYKKGLDLSRGAPTLMHGYGGFNVSVTPSFSVPRLAWMEMGGIFVVANVRGGGEYGKDWHNAGRLLNKQNGFDDFIAAGEALVQSGITTPRQLAIMGGSNGGLLVGAVVNQRPDLFAAALPQVGVMDMLRYNRFTAGRYWVDDYGDPADEAQFRNLFAYSPYHNVKGGRPYPAILVTTADTDDRVVPGHSFKYAAALQAMEIGDKPHLIRIETRAGHGSGKPTAKQIEENADMWAFAGFHTGLTADR
ncbi:prolyl oligopeptidase family serine peptidase [Sphingosinicella rhizophila]|uniref:prolyl oligopeptidase n=1 Tax=Sphingosinicella rhizophila TaxID=3050082 RepID=A0ABU3QAG1_9SPHN|nr:prolyl oligopeptidase family serine peptidase [Sphingosinicella sp. GR2756]MDT9600346.1 prolyl oligopeptidase family serine peptidase [Sphingosinicella sp. GR2756]